MATAKKKSPKKKATPAKKVAIKPRNSDSETEYFMKNGKAYVRVQSGDVFGPYSPNSAAGKTARANSGGTAGPSRSSGGNMGGRGNIGGGLRKHGR